MTWLKVQPDEVGRVVRVLAGDPDDPITLELDPERAQAIGERLAAAGDEMLDPASEFAGVVAEEQLALDEVEPTTESLDALLAEVDDDPPHIGEVINENDPLEY